MRPAHALLVAILVAPWPALAGDPTAHTGAMVQAAQVVIRETEFSSGVGARQIDHRPTPEDPIPFAIPLNFSELRCDYDPSRAFNGSCAFQDDNGKGINRPDFWTCDDSTQPPVLSTLNIALGPWQSAVAPAEACNYNHFVDNPALGDLYTAPRAGNTVLTWAYDITSSITSDTCDWTCNDEDWHTYYQRVANALHYVQDATTEHHAQGNVVCTPSTPAITFNQFVRFKDIKTCAGFLNNTLRQAVTNAPDIVCDQEVVDPGVVLTYSTNVIKLKFLCANGSPFACMGLERLLRHHCNLADTAKSIVCTGPADDHLLSTNRLQYCEGELYNHGGGQDFLGAATAASVPILENAMRNWATACKQPDDPCDQAQCETWCKRKTPPDPIDLSNLPDDGTLPPATCTMRAQETGYCVNDAPAADCKWHTCQCDLVTACGHRGSPCCPGAVCSDSGTECSPWTNRCVAMGCAGACPQMPPDPESCPMDPSAPPGTVGASTGDPHLMTFDRVRYDAQGVGELILAHDKVDGTMIQARTRPLTTRVAVNAAIAASVGPDIIAFYADGTVRINHVVTEVVPGKTMLNGGGALYRTGKTYVVVWPDNSQLHVRTNGSFVGSVHFYVADDRRSRMEGLLGNFDGSSLNELVTRTGSAVPMPPSFADFYHTYLDSWRIVPSESLFDYGPGETTDTFTDRAFPPEPFTTQGLSDSARAVASAICEAARVPPDWFDACVLDVGLTGNPDFAGELAGAPPSDTAIDTSGGGAPLPSPIGGTVPAGACVATGSMADARLGFEARAVTLSNGKVLVAGGLDTGAGHVLASAELYDPATGTFSSAGAMSRPRMRFALVPLGNGKLLAAGGVNDAGTLEASADIYDPVLNAWTPTGSMASARCDFSAATLPDGTVLVVGGLGATSSFDRSTGVVNSGSPLRGAEIYDPHAGTFSAAANTVVAGATMFAVSPRLDGSVFAATGATGELFTGSGATAQFSSIGALPTTITGAGVFAMTLPTGDVFALPALALSDPLAGRTVGGPVVIRAGTDQAAALSNDTIGGTSAAIRLVTGDVFLVGGQRAGAATADTQVYRLASAAWQTPGSTRVVRHGPVLANLPDGAVLVMGGCQANACGATVLRTAELCNPAAPP